MKTSNKGINLIKNFESFQSRAYLCPAGVLTIGYGHTGPDVKQGMVITESQGTQFLTKDLARAENAINKFVRVEINQNQFDALADFIFNVGVGAFEGSTLLDKFNNNDIQGAADEFLRWNKAKGKVLDGLTRRREAERSLFLSE